MAVLLLYPLQLAVNTVKAPLAPASVHVCFFLLAGALLSSSTSPTLASPRAGRVVAGPGKVPALSTRSRA